MKVIPIRPRGFCPGVVNAVKIVENVIKDKNYPRPIQILGMIVHNRHVVDEFTSQGVITIEGNHASRLEMIDQIKDGTVIITAHGISDIVHDKLKEKNVIIVDATCRDVYRTQTMVKDRLNLGYDVIYIGRKNHPETESVEGLSNCVHVVESVEDLKKLVLSNDFLFVTNQTTFSIKDIEEILYEIKKLFPNALVSDEICDSTRIRQEAILKANVLVDACFIVGDHRSNNTHNLVKISREQTNTLTYLIETEKDITEEMLDGVKVVSVSSGASTPTHITKKVIDYLSNYSS